MAVRQESAAGTGRIKRPRLQIVVSEPIVEKVEALAKERGTSVSATCAWILERHFEQAPSPSPRGKFTDYYEDLVAKKKAEAESVDDDEADLEKMMKLMQMMKMAKKAGIF